MYETITDSINDKLSHILNLWKAFTKFSYFSPLNVVEENKFECVSWWRNLKGGRGNEQEGGLGSVKTYNNNRWGKVKKIW